MHLSLCGHEQPVRVMCCNIEYWGYTLVSETKPDSIPDIQRLASADHCSDVRLVASSHKRNAAEMGRLNAIVSHLMPPQGKMKAR